MLIVKLVFPDQYQAGLMFTQNVTSNTIASKKISERDLPRQKRDLAFPDVSQMRFRDFFLSSSVKFHQKNPFGIQADVSFFLVRTWLLTKEK